LQLNSIGSEITGTGTFGQAKATEAERELVAVHVGHLFEEGTVQVEAFQDGRYTVGSPWKGHHKVLPLNYRQQSTKIEQ